MVCTCTDLIRLVLEPNMHLSLISVLVTAFSAASLVSATPTGPSTTGEPNSIPKVCIVYGISYWLTNFSSSCRAHQLLKEYQCPAS